jgi:hypothetical protein
MTRREDGPQVSLHPETARRLLAGDPRARRVLEGQLALAEAEARRQAWERERRGLDELWQVPGVLSAALDRLELEARTAGRVIKLKCPACGERRAFLYRDAVAPGVSCNRRNTCPLGQSQRPVPVFALLARELGGKREAMEALRRWAEGGS